MLILPAGGLHGCSSALCVQKGRQRAATTMRIESDRVSQQPGHHQRAIPPDVLDETSGSTPDCASDATCGGRQATVCRNGKMDGIVTDGHHGPGIIGGIHC
eukprot:5155999-Amphidinium_carterae.1